MSTDLGFLNEIKAGLKAFDSLCCEEIGYDISIEYPLDNKIREELDKISLRDDDQDFEIFRFFDQLISLWQTLIEKSVKALRYYDDREPFKANPGKKPVAYGVDDLRTYFDKYVKFEKTLYGSSRYYRDHVVHVFRVWILGITQLFANDNALLKEISIDEDCKVNPIEKISIWTLIALTHDLGYPLEKSLEVVERTKDMMKSFVVNPIISMDLCFNGVQNSMNDFVLRFMSSKMKKKEGNSIEGYDFVARLQPKYYFKFQKSLEHNKHGILSALVIYKMLRYFLESDYSTNEDYFFKKEDVRQFYIRRDILRAISSHTCHDIYQLTAKNFSFLLILCDDAQEWGRKSISELYINKTIEYEYDGLNIDLSQEIINVSFCEKFKNIDKEEDVETVLSRFIDISLDYNEIFRDGLDTSNRNFCFQKKTEIDFGKSNGKVTITLSLNITKEESSKIKVVLYAKNQNCSNYRKVVGMVSKLFKPQVEPVEGSFVFELSELKKLS